MVKIPLTQGKFVLVDKQDVHLRKFKWHFVAKKYAARDEPMVNRKRGKRIYMHRSILSASVGQEVDHINHNTLDNRRSNLRICTHQENISNQSLSRANTSGFKGVHHTKESGRRKKFIAYIKVNQKRRVIGYYMTAEEAAVAYNQAALISFGKYAHLNKI